jgi:serine phosphatase RsbU (regulator of sigma subunit)
MTDAVVRLSEDVARRVAQAVATARRYTKQASISSSLQRRQLPTSLAIIPGVDTAIVYEPCGEGQTVGGDFYDLFPMGSHRWCFLLGDVCGHDLEAMSATGLARHLVRLLAREGHGVESLLNRLNVAMAEEAAEALAMRGEHEGSRFLSLLYGELQPDLAGGGARCTVASAGHPTPLRLATDGSVTKATDPQMLLGIDEQQEFHANTLTLAPGETLLCVTDGVTERRRGVRQLDDDDGLAKVLRGCLGLGAKAVAERVRRAAHDFSAEPIDDDLAVLVVQAVPSEGSARSSSCRDERGH